MPVSSNPHYGGRHSQQELQVKDVELMNSKTDAQNAAAESAVCCIGTQMELHALTLSCQRIAQKTQEEVRWERENLRVVTLSLRRLMDNNQELTVCHFHFVYFCMSHAHTETCRDDADGSGRGDYEIEIACVVVAKCTGRDQRNGGACLHPLITRIFLIPTQAVFPELEAEKAKNGLLWLSLDDANEYNEELRVCVGIHFFCIFLFLVHRSNYGTSRSQAQWDDAR